MENQMHRKWVKGQNFGKINLATKFCFGLLGSLKRNFVPNVINGKRMLEDMKVISAYSPDTLCVNCMQNKESSQALCLHCGYDERKYKGHPLYLKPKTVLKNQYFIGNPLGQGGFGITYVGLDKWLQKKIALKEFLPSTLATRNFLTSEVVPVKKQETAFKDGLRLFINEARHLAKFDHPNIVRVINFFEENQTGYMVMDYLEGDSPTHILNQAGGKLPVHTALAILLPILDALIEIHAHHVYHLDISVQNVRILKTGTPILIDFGAARQIVGEYSHSLDLILKHGYSPLEQYSRKGKIGPWTDVYASGALLYLLITGHLPPAATDRFCEESLLSPREILGDEVSEAVSQTIMCALAIRSEDRFQTVGEFKAALQGQSFILPQTLSAPSSPSHVGIAKTLSVLGLLMAVSGFFYAMNFEWIDSWFKSFSVWHVQSSPQHDEKVSPAHTEVLKQVEHNYQQARLAQETGQFVESLQHIEEGLRRMPQHAHLNELKQILLKQKKQAEEQVQHLHTWLNQASQAVQHFRLEEAYGLFQKVLTLEPSHPAAQQGLEQIAQTYLQLIHQKQDNRPEQWSLLKQGLRLFPQHPTLLSLQQTFLTQQREEEEKMVRQRKINELLKKAVQQRVALRLTEPTGNNAYETYLQILNLDPHDSAAQQGLVALADEYEKLARIKQNDTQKNLVLIEKGLKIIPRHSGLLTLRQSLLEQKQAEKTTMLFPKKPVEFVQEVSPSPPVPARQEQSEQVIPSKPKAEAIVSSESKIQHNENIPSKESVTVETTTQQKPDEPPVSSNILPDQIQHLLTLAQQQIALNQWEEATINYQNILKKESHHAQAQAGLDQIVAHYEELARKKEQQGQFFESLEIISKGLSINSHHKELLALRSKIEQHLEKPRELSPPAHIIFTPSF